MCILYLYIYNIDMYMYALFIKFINPLSGSTLPLMSKIRLRQNEMIK